MDRALNARLEKETIYEIYRACRLCGAGAGYKMPIMQNVIDLEDSEINLSKKIRECVRIEVHADDKMPPLICELCVDKVNDFYEFLKLCRQTNKQTRLKLGLPMQTILKGVSDSGDCILGDTTPVYVTEDSDGEPLSKHKSKMKVKDKEKERIKEKDRLKSRVKKEPEVKIKVEPLYNDRSRTCRRPPAPATPPPVRVTRTSCNANDLIGGLQFQEPQRKKPASKSIVKKEKEDIKVEDDSPRLKRVRDKDVKTEVPMKKAKILVEQSPQKANKQSTPKSKSKPTKRPASPPAKHTAGPAKHPVGTAKHPAAPVKHPAGTARREKSPARRPEYPANPAALHTCNICSQVQKNSQGYHNHLRSHTVTFTRPTLACNACGEWFPTYDDACSHHRNHKHNCTPYKCRRCSGEFKTHQSYEEHFGQSQCIPYDEMPDVKCGECWRYFATDRLLIEHKCAGEEGRPGGKCLKCNRTYVLLKNLRRHETTCMHRRRISTGEVIADPEVMASLKLVQIRVARCDPLLEKERDGHYDVSGVRDFGYDPNCIYPYKTIRIKIEPFDGMVKIQEEVKEEFCSDEYVHWDSTDSEEEVDSLMTLSLKTIFSQKMLGRVLRKKREHLEDKTIDVSSDTYVSDDGFKGFDVDCELNDVSFKVKDALEKDCVNDFDKQLNSVHTDLNTNVKDRLDTEKSIGDEKSQNGELNNEIEDFGNSKLNGNDTNDSFEDIDGSKLIAALNAQIGEDDEIDTGERNFKDLSKNELGNGNENNDKPEVNTDLKAQIGGDEKIESDKEGSFKDLSKNELGDGDDNKREIDVSKENQNLNDKETEHFNDNEHSDGNHNEKCKIDVSKENEILNNEEMEFNDKSKEIGKDNELISNKDNEEMKDFNMLKNDKNIFEKNASNVNNTLQNNNSDACAPKDDDNNDLETTNTLKNEKNTNFEDACVKKDDIIENGHKDGQQENGKCDKLSLEDLLEKDLEKDVGLEDISDEDYNFDV